MKNFAQRMGITPAEKEIQKDSLDIDLKNQLWNIIYIIFSHYIEKRFLEDVSVAIWQQFFKKPIDTIPSRYDLQRGVIRDWFFAADWYRIYDFIEFIVRLDARGFFEPTYYNEELCEEFNIVLHEEFSAYRFLDGKIVPIINEIEIAEIDEAIGNNLTPNKGANIHLQKALEKLSDRKHPDYRNSIKESISAVEAVCRELTGESTLGTSLDKLKNKGYAIHDQLKQGFVKIYAYTNGRNGVRHAIMDGDNIPDFNDAKYMLVACSSFVNYLAGKKINNL